VAKLGVDGGRRWLPPWKQFPNIEGDGDLTDGGAWSSSWRPSGVRSRNGGICVGTMVAAVATACEENENLPSGSNRKVGPEFIVSSISSSSTWNHC
jgi:hypothetical protein